MEMTASEAEVKRYLRLFMSSVGLYGSGMVLMTVGLLIHNWPWFIGGTLSFFLSIFLGTLFLSKILTVFVRKSVNKPGE